MEMEQTEVTSHEAIAFPSLEWFERLAQLMGQNRARNEHLGYIDCVAIFTVLGRWSARQTVERASHLRRV